MVFEETLLQVEVGKAERQDGPSGVHVSFSPLISLAGQS